MKLTVRNSLILGIAGATAFIACAKVPITGRRQLNLIPKSTMHDLGATTYQEILGQARVVQSGPNNVVLQRAGQAIIKEAGHPGYDWELALIDDETANAWCLPGGKIGFHTGILPILENEAGLAFVMGHEVAHATARHGSERMSQQLALVGGMQAIDLYLSGRGKVSDSQRQLILGALGLGAQYGVALPYSRKHESEADIIGLMYMASAGYKPEESIEVWNRMDSASGAKPPTFMSTHPSNAQRRATLTEWMPQARKRYERNQRPASTLAPVFDMTDADVVRSSSKGSTTSTDSTGSNR